MTKCAAIFLLATGCAARTTNAPGTPAWGDDSRSGLAAQGTAIEPERSSVPPQVLPETSPSEVVEGPASSAPDPQPAATDDDAPMPPGAPVVRLIDAGAEPRRRLRYRLAGPKTEEVTIDLNTTVATNMGGGPEREVTTPGMRMIMSMTSAPAGRGVITSSSRVTEVDALESSGSNPAVAEKIRTEVRKLVGMRTDATVTTRGAIIETRTTMPPTASPSATGALDSMQSSVGRTTMLPAEAVGVGARWEVESDVQQNGMTIHQRSRYRLRELVGSRLGLDVQMALSAGAQEMKLPNAGGATAQLESLRGTGTGTVSADLTQLMPRLAQVTVDSQMSMRVQSMSLSMRTKMDLNMRAGR